jgi:hypothetical protein
VRASPKIGEAAAGHPFNQEPPSPSGGGFLRTDSTNLTDMPGYWRNEQSGRLETAVWAYLEGDRLDEEQIALIGAYLRQWVDALRGPEIAALRARVEELTSRQALDRWMSDALRQGIDPL